MFDNQKTRQQLYDRIRETSKAEVILEEMKRLGFWAKNEQEPGLPEQLIRQEAALIKELNALNAQKRKFQNKEAMLREMRIKRMAEAKKKTAESTDGTAQVIGTHSLKPARQQAKDRKRVGRGRCGARGWSRRTGTTRRP